MIEDIYRLNENLHISINLRTLKIRVFDFEVVKKLVEVSLDILKIHVVYARNTRNYRNCST